TTKNLRAQCVLIVISSTSHIHTHPYPYPARHSFNRYHHSLPCSLWRLDQLPRSFSEGLWVSCYSGQSQKLRDESPSQQNPLWYAGDSRDQESASLPSLQSEAS